MQRVMVRCSGVRNALITVSQSQAEPTSAGTMRTTILIPEAPRRGITILITDDDAH